MPRGKGVEISRQSDNPEHAAQKGKRVIQLEQTETVNEGNAHNDGEWHLYNEQRLVPILVLM